MKHAQYVLAVMQEGGITAAARALYISQPSLSQTIKLVEQEMGMPIFERGTNPLRLTYAGTRYVEAVRRVMVIEENLGGELAALRGETRGRMRLGFSVQRGMTLLPQVLPLFVAKYPHIRVELVEQGSVMLEKRVAEGECDIALVTTTPHRPELDYTLVQNERIVLVASNETEFARTHPDGAEIELSEAAKEKFVTLSLSHSVRVVQDSLFALHGMKPEILLETNTMETGKRLAASCGAVMLCPDVYVMDDAELAGRVKFYPLRHNEFARHSYFCYRKGTYLTRYMRDFLTILQSVLPRLDEGEDEIVYD